MAKTIGLSFEERFDNVALVFFRWSSPASRCYGAIMVRFLNLD
jgi:hypothetical protein